MTFFHYFKRTILEEEMLDPYSKKPALKNNNTKAVYFYFGI